MPKPYESAPTADRVVRPQETAHKLGYKNRKSVYDLVASGLLPPPIKIGLRASGWRESTLNAYIASRESASTPKS